jgi:tRNA(Phe) wybutosine-synthesizing methylase Tyw3
MGHRRFLSKKHPHRAMDCHFNGGKKNREVPLHATGDLVHLKVKDIQTIKELTKLTENPWQKKEMRW